MSKTTEKKSLRVVGIMSGTSLDGVDFVLTKISSKGIKYTDLFSLKFPTKMKEELHKLSEGHIGFRESQHIHYRLGEFYQKSLEKAIRFKNWKFDLIGLHGQTVYHDAPRVTTQIGEPGFLTKFNVPVVSDFRSKLICHKTQGAPLAPLFHEQFLDEKTGFLNLGGMSNITIKKTGKLLATDLGPGNIFLDKAMQILYKKDFDRGGVFCSRGLPDLNTVKSYLKGQKFFKKRLPKSCGREEFSEEELRRVLLDIKRLSSYDKLSTIAEITLTPILDFCKKYGVQNLYVSGGGAKNKYFMERLSYELKGWVKTSADIGWPVEAIEGGAFAYLAYKKIRNESLNLSYLGLSRKFSALGRVD